MHRPTAKLLVTSVLALTLTAVAQEKKIARSALPPAVEKTVQAQSQGATIKGFATDREYEDLEALITEAGGRITSADGADFDLREGTALASNLELHPQILELLNAAKG